MSPTKHDTKPNMTLSHRRE